MPEGCAEELDEAGVGEFLAVGAFELAVVKEEIAGDAHAQGYLASRASGYLDSGGLVVGTSGYLDRGALSARRLVWGSVAMAELAGVIGLVGLGCLGARDPS